MDFIKNFPFFGIMLTMLAAIISLPMHGKMAKRISLFVFSVETLLAAAVLFYTLQTGESFVYIMGAYWRAVGKRTSCRRFGRIDGLLFQFGNVIIHYRRLQTSHP